MPHVVLLGDSIFDNAVYVAGEPGGESVIQHLNRRLPEGWQATLLARDGAIAADVANQLQQVPGSATHFVVSAGGNNALDWQSLVRNGQADSYAEVFWRMAEIRDEFQREYREMLENVLALGKPTAVCTVYDAIPELPPSDAAALGLFNETILREAFRAGTPVIDLRLICTEGRDYSTLSPIEPSSQGGAKIARAICRVLLEGQSAAGGRWTCIG